MVTPQRKGDETATAEPLWFMVWLWAEEGSLTVNSLLGEGGVVATFPFTAFGIHHQRRLPHRPTFVQRPIDAPIFVKVLVAGVSGRPVMGHSGEGRLL